MTLSRGDKLGPYEVLELIGSGGMGNVYRGVDPRLGREVAIKVSAEQFSERVDREARAVAALNHPNICTLYDVGPNYLVMELVDGKSPKGPLPLEEALGISMQIADALSEAHEKGIVHRDLKPANIKIKPDGTVKVLDFGLAKVVSEIAPNDDSATVALSATRPGMIVGSPGYMSPEQALGKPADNRADIWAFGVVMHELLTGRNVFARENVTETLANVIHAEPTWNGIPARVQPLLKKCLEKDPRQRLRDIGDARALLEFPAPMPDRRRGATAWIVAAILLAALGIAVWSPRRASKSEAGLVRLRVDLGSDVFLPSPQNSLSSVILSPDGNQLAFVSGAPAKLFTRNLAEDATHQYPDTENAEYPFYSPDGKWIGFFSNGKLNKVPAEGGPITEIGEGFSATGASWGQGDIIVAGGQLKGGGLVQVSARGGPVTDVTRLNEGEFVHALPQILPGGKAVLFTVHVEPRDGSVDDATVEVVTLNDHQRKVLVRGGTAPRYIEVSDGVGYLFYNKRSSLYAVPLNLKRLESSGTAVAVASDVGYHEVSGVAQYDVSRAGTLVYRRGASESTDFSTVEPNRMIQLLTPGHADKSAPEPFLSKRDSFLSAVVSPDGKELALVTSEAKKATLSVIDMQRELTTRLPWSGDALNIVWSPDGRYLLFRSLVGIVSVRSDGASKPKPLIEKAAQIPWSIHSDRLAYTQLEANSVPQIWTVPLEEKDGQLNAGQPEPFRKGEGGMEPRFSPDGKWLAYRSVENPPEIFVSPFPPPKSGDGPRIQISNGEGSHPAWSPGGHDILYQNGDRIMAVSYSEEAGVFVPERPRVWLEHLGGTTLSWEMMPNGKSIMVVSSPSPVAQPSMPSSDATHVIMFVENLLDELQRRIPPGR